MPSTPGSSASGAAMIQAGTPEALIHGRVAALAAGDYSAIFASYHPEAPFLRCFPDRDAYLAYAAENLAGAFRISDCRILRSRMSGEQADVLFIQTIEHGKEHFASLEIGRCRVDGDGWWSFEAGLRLDATLLPDDPARCSWDELLAAGNGLWI